MERIPQRKAFAATLIVLLALVSTACGAVVTASDQRARQNAVVEVPVAGPPPVAPANAVEGGHQYGATLEEWTGVDQDQQDTAPGDAASDSEQSDTPEIEWADLIPAGSSGPELMARFEERLDAVEPGSVEANTLYAEIQAEFDPEAVNPDLDGTQIRLAGFVAPLTFEDDIVTEFLLVPTFGACIHVPPPPPNQTVMVSVHKADGLTIDESWGAVWVEGTMVVESATTDIGSTSYRITNAMSGEYTDY